MKALARFLAGFVALQHIGFLVLEMFLWTHPIGLKVFKQTAEAAESSRVLASNQGLYNGFLAAGLIWGLISTTESQGKLRFFLLCVIVAGIFGAATASFNILFVQALPALLALIFVEISHGEASKEEQAPSPPASSPSSSSSSDGAS